MFCKNCGSDMQQGQAFCLKCGFKSGTGANNCANCSAIVSPGANVCMQCGYAIGGGAAKSPSAQNVQEKPIFCKNCANTMQKGQAFCLGCGFKAGTGSTYCATCGGEVQAGAAICTKCGHSLKGSVVSGINIPNMSNISIDSLKDQSNWPKLLWMAFIALCALTFISFFFAFTKVGYESLNLYEHFNHDGLKFMGYEGGIFTIFTFICILLALITPIAAKFVEVIDTHKVKIGLTLVVLADILMIFGAVHPNEGYANYFKAGAGFIMFEIFVNLAWVATVAILYFERKNKV